MITQKDGGPTAAGMLCAEGVMTPVGGLSKREYFAAMAMQGMLASGNFSYDSDEQDGTHDELSRMKTYDDDGDKATWKDACVYLAVTTADAILAELSREDEP